MRKEAVIVVGPRRAVGLAREADQVIIIFAYVLDTSLIVFF